MYARATDARQMSRIEYNDSNDDIDDDDERMKNSIYLSARTIVLNSSSKPLANDSCCGTGRGDEVIHSSSFEGARARGRKVAKEERCRRSKIAYFEIMTRSSACQCLPTGAGFEVPSLKCWAGAREEVMRVRHDGCLREVRQDADVTF